MSLNDIDESLACKVLKFAGDIKISVQYEYFCSAIKQDVALRPGSNIKPNTSS